MYQPVSINPDLHKELKKLTIEEGTIKSWAEKFIILGLKFENLSEEKRKKILEFIESQQ